MCSCFSSACLACRLRQVRTGCRLRSSADRSLQVLYPRGPQLWCRRFGGGMARTHLDFIHISLAPHWLDCPGRRITRGGGCGPSFFLSSPPLQHQAATVPQHFMGTKLGQLAHFLKYLPPHHGPETRCVFDCFTIRDNDISLCDLPSSMASSQTSQVGQKGSQEGEAGRTIWWL